MATGREKKKCCRTQCKEEICTENGWSNEGKEDK
jgi:hypothetical protein